MTMLPTRRGLLAGLAAVPFAPAISRARGVADPAARTLVAAAESQIGVTRIYDAAYVNLAFPGGDVPMERGVCTDVVVRAYRKAFNFDLQAAVNADMKAHFGAYPKRWGLSSPDANIDHRRVPNLQVYFARRKAELAKPATPEEWNAGDIVTMLVPGGRPHIGIVSDTLALGTLRPKVIHNIGFGTQNDDILGLLTITGRYRLLAPA